VPNESKKIVALSINGETLHIQDLPLSLIDKVAKANDCHWLQVVHMPMADLGVAQALIEAVCEHLSTSPPQDLSVKSIIPFFIDLDDDVPQAPEGSSDDDPFALSGNES